MTTKAGQGARIFLTDDHPAVQDGLALLLAQDRHVVCGVAASREEVRERLAGARAELLLLDLALCGESGLDILRDVSGLDLPVLVYSMHEDAATVRRALDGGALGYVSKREPSAVLLEAVRQVLDGSRYVSPRAAANLDDAGDSSGLSRALSEREQQILVLLAGGETNSDIAATLGVSVRTVETYFSRMLFKLDMEGMKALRKYALQMGRLSER